MAYLNNSTITVDAILTKKGRELFAKSSADFRITKFALSDDEIDYRLYDKTHPSGSAYYADAIENLPVLEALPDDSKMLKYKLISLPKGTGFGHVITVGQTSYPNMWMEETYRDSRNKSNVQPASEVIIVPQTSAKGDETLGYTAVLYDNSYLDLTVVASTRASTQPTVSVADGSSNTTTKVGQTFKVRVARPLPSGQNSSGTITLRITGNESGQSVTVTFIVKRRSAYDTEISSET